MFRNKHLNFGYLLVILVVFAIAISTSYKPGYALAEEAAVEKKGKHELIITFDADTGEVQLDDSFPRGDEKNHNKKVKEKTKALTGPITIGEIKDIIDCRIILYTKNPTCITFEIGGKMYTYCW